MKPIQIAGLSLLGICLLCSPANSQAGGSEESFTPQNPPEMKPVPGRNTPAYRAAKWFLRGANLGDYLETPPGSSWGVKVSADEFAAMKREGFDHVRIPIGWHHYTGPGPDYTLRPEIFAKVDFAVTNALQNKLAVMINIHHFDKLDRDPTNAAAEFLAIWRQIAVHYEAFSPRLAFELDNEPHDQATTAVMNPIYAQAITEIRQSNPHRTIFVEPGGWGSIPELKNLVLPPDDNVIVSVHCYDPFFFTHQGADWTGGITPVTGIIFPGPPPQPLAPDPALKLNSDLQDWISQYNTLPTNRNPSSPIAFADRLKYIHQWSEYYHRPIHLGEFGAYTRADEQSRVNFYRAFRIAAEQNKLGWCIWDWSAGFRYWDRANHRPMPGMHEALFGKNQ
ncbi:MAG TPA: glycoside hydrolase family 5 protein [Candidatus Acidoferrales bacterium]|nr:glycoside hydrolase family 5 protein [Candidatus Acidoferrales bacterium]